MHRRERSELGSACSGTCCFYRTPYLELPGMRINRDLFKRLHLPPVITVLVICSIVVLRCGLCPSSAPGEGGSGWDLSCMLWLSSILARSGGGSSREGRQHSVLCPSFLHFYHIYLTCRTFFFFFFINIFNFRSQIKRFSFCFLFE